MTVLFSSWNSPTRTKGKIACCKLSIVCSPFYFWILRREKSYKWLSIITLTSTAFWKVTKEEGGGGGLISFQARILRIFLHHVLERKTLNIFLVYKISGKS